MRTAVQEDADAVGLSLLSGAHLTLVPKVVEGLRAEGLGDVVVMCGGIIPERDMDELRADGVGAVFTPGAPLSEIATWLEAALDEREHSTREHRRARARRRGKPPRAPARGRHRRSRVARHHDRPAGPERTTTNDYERQTVDLVEYQGKQYFARYGIPISPGDAADTVAEAEAVAEAARLPGRREGPGAGGRSGQGGRRQARRQPRRGDRARRQHPRPRHQGPRRAPPVDRAGDRHREGVLRQLHLRPGRQVPPRHGLGQGRRRHRAGRRGGPRGDRPPAHRPARRAVRGGREDARRRGRARPRGARRGRRHLAEALHLLRRGRRRPRRDQPADAHHRTAACTPSTPR